MPKSKLVAQRSGKWAATRILKARTGWIVEHDCAIQGYLTGWRRLLTYSDRWPETFVPDFNHTITSVLIHEAHYLGRVLRRGILVR